VYGLVIPPTLLTTGTHTVTVTDVGGNLLATGTLSITS
jgi:hypothetical protein